MKHKLFFSDRFDRDSRTKEIVRAYFNRSYDQFYDFLQDILSCFDSKLAIALGKNLYKLNISPPAFKKGKRKAYRLIIAFFRVKNVITPVVIYKKSVLVNISKKKLLFLLEDIVEEMK